MSDNEDRLKRRAIREKNARKEAERLLEEKSLQLYALNNEISRFAERLELQVQERTRELEVATKKAEQANESKSKFLANMSHELRTPLNGVLGMISLTLKTRLDKDQQKYLTLAQSSVNSLLTVINDILDFSKIEAGQINFEWLDFNVREITEEIALIQSRVAHEKGLDLHLDSNGLAESVVSGDPTRFRQIIDNLVNNAIKFTEQGEVCITLSSKTTAHHHLVTCTVRDTGLGIPRDKQNLLFKSFTQIDDSTTRVHGGTGLGLSISQQLCQLMGGQLSFTSSENQGSEFCVEIPFDFPNKRPLPDTATVRDNFSVLLLQPPGMGRSILCQMLQKQGCHVVIVDCTEDLNTQSRKPGNEHIRYVFIDASFDNSAASTFQLPEKATKVLIMPVAYQPDNTWFNELGFRACLVQPFSHRELKHLIADTKHRSKPEKNLLNEKSQKIDFSKFTVLLAEDNVINQHVAQGLLNVLGIVSYIANNGEEVLHLLRRNEVQFDLIFMDCQMPVMDGYEATQEIRAGNVGSHYTDLPIVALTASALDEDIKRSFKAGMTDHLSKPIALTNLRKVLKKCLVSNAGPAREVNPKLNTPALMDIGELTTKLEKLKSLLDSYDAESVAFLRSLQTEITQSDLKKTLRHIHALTRQYRFEDASESVTKLLLNLTQNP